MNAAYVGIAFVGVIMAVLAADVFIQRPHHGRTVGNLGSITFVCVDVPLDESGPDVVLFNQHRCRIVSTTKVPDHVTRQ